MTMRIAFIIVLELDKAGAKSLVGSKLKDNSTSVDVIPTLPLACVELEPTLTHAISCWKTKVQDQKNAQFPRPRLFQPRVSSPPRGLTTHMLCQLGQERHFPAFGTAVLSVVANCHLWPIQFNTATLSVQLVCPPLLPGPELTPCGCPPGPSLQPVSSVSQQSRILRFSPVPRINLSETDPCRRVEPSPRTF